MQEYLMAESSIIPQYVFNGHEEEQQRKRAAYSAKYNKPEPAGFFDRHPATNMADRMAVAGTASALTGGNAPLRLLGGAAVGSILERRGEKD